MSRLVRTTPVVVVHEELIVEVGEGVTKGLLFGIAIGVVNGVGVIDGKVLSAPPIGVVKGVGLMTGVVVLTPLVALLSVEPADVGDEVVGPLVPVICAPSPAIKKIKIVATKNFI